MMIVWGIVIGLILIVIGQAIYEEGFAAGRKNRRGKKRR